MTGIDDTTESRLREALRERAGRVVLDVPPVAVVIERNLADTQPSATGTDLRPRRRPKATPRFLRPVVLAAAALAVVGIGRLLVQDKPSDLRVVGPDPSTATTGTTAPARLLIGEARPLNERVVYRTRWGAGPQQVGFVPGNESADTSPTAIAPSPDGKTVYISDNANDRVVAVDVETGRVSRTIRGVFADDLAVDPVSGALYALWGASHIQRIDADGAVELVQEDTRAGGPNSLAVVGAQSPHTGLYIHDGSRLHPLPRQRGEDVSGRPVLPGWPMGDDYVRLDISDGELRLSYLDSAEQPLRTVLFGTQPGWAVAQIDDVTVVDGRLLVVVTESNPGHSRSWRSRLLKIEAGGRLTAVHEVVKAEAQWIGLTKISPDAVWALDETKAEAVLRRDDIR